MKNETTWNNEEFDVTLSKERLQNLRELNETIQVMAISLKKTRDELDDLQKDVASVRLKLLNYEVLGR